MNRIILIGFVLLIGCQKIDPPTADFTHRHFWRDALAVTEVEFISKTGGVMEFDLHVVAMKSGATDYLIPFDAFKTTGGFSLGTTIYPDSVIYSENNSVESFQTIILVDETAVDWSLVSDGHFPEAINRMNKEAKAEKDQYFGVGYYARDEYYGHSPVNFFRHPESNSLFEHDENEMMQYLVNSHMYTDIAESSSLYDAISVSIDELMAEPLSNNQSVTVILASADDGAGSISYTNLLQKCLDNNIKINLVVQGEFSYDFYRLALETGGFISDNTGTSYSGYYYNTSESVLFHVYDILSRNYKEYIIRCRAQRTSNWGTGSTFSGFIEANYFKEEHSIYFEDDLYDDLDFNQKLPIWIRVQ